MPDLQQILITQDDLVLRYAPQVAPALAFGDRDVFQYAVWRVQAQAKLQELLGLTLPAPCQVHVAKERVLDDVRVTSLIMRITDDLTIPAYLLTPKSTDEATPTVLAIHGHGEVDGALGLREDYHHRFALRLAQAGWRVLLPELRGFGALQDMAAQLQGYRLDYWNWGSHMAYSLVTDELQMGHTLIGETVADLLRWEEWLHMAHGVDRLAAVGISYGGDLALTYPVWSERVERIFASGSLGSFLPIFRRCYNAPAHCIPGVLRWLDRADIAGLSAPTPIMLHYGALDVPGPSNYSAAYNETVLPSVEHLRRIYAAAGASDRLIRLEVSPKLGHEMDIPLLMQFLRG